MIPGVHQVQNVLKKHKYFLSSEIQKIFTETVSVISGGETKDILNTDIYKIVDITILVLW